MERHYRSKYRCPLCGNIVMRTPTAQVYCAGCKFELYSEDLLGDLVSSLHRSAQFWYHKGYTDAVSALKPTDPAPDEVSKALGQNDLSEHE